MTELVALFATSQIKMIVTLIAVDVVLGIIAALIKKDFRLGKLAGFMKKGAVGYVLGFAVLELVAAALPSLAMFTSLAYILVVLALISSILTNIAKMGVSLPAYLLKE